MATDPARGWTFGPATPAAPAPQPAATPGAGWSFGPAQPAQPTPAQPQVNPIDQLRTPAMRQRVMRIAAATKQPWQQVEAQIAQTSQQTGRGVDVLVGSMEQASAQPPAPMPGPQAAEAAPAASQAAAAKLRQQGVPGPQRAGASAQVEQKTAQQPAQPPAPGPAAGPKPAVPPGQAPQWAQNIALNLPRAAGEAANQLWNVSLDRPLQQALWVMGRPAELTESFLTGGQGYDKTWLKGIQNPTERGLAQAALKTVLDPTNLLMFPGVVAKGVTLGARILDVAEKSALAAREAPHVSQAVGIVERALMEGKMAGPIKGTLAPKVNAAVDWMINAGKNVRGQLDITANLPPAVKQAVVNHRAGQAAVSRKALGVLNDYFRMIPSEGDRAMLHQVIEGTASQQYRLASIPQMTKEQLTRAVQPLWDRIGLANRDIKTLSGVTLNPQRVRKLERDISGLATETLDIGRTMMPQESRAIEAEIRELQDHLHVATGGGAIERRVATLQGGIEKLQDRIKTIIDSHDEQAAAAAARRVVQGVPQRLQKAFDSLQALMDQQESRSVMGGLVNHTRDNYIKALYPAADFNQVGRMGGDVTAFQAGAKQMLPRGQPWSAVIPSAFQKTFPTSVEARIAGFHPILDVARSAAAKEMELGQAENNLKMLDTLSGLGEDWVRSGADPAAVIPDNWVAGRNLVGQRTAAMHVSPSGERLADLHFHPDIGALARELVGAREPSALLRNLTTGTTAMKKSVFGFLPFFHGGNIWRSAFEADGLRVFDPRHWAEWKAAAKDAREFGPDTQAYLADGGSMDTSSVAAMRHTINEIMTADPAKTALQATGIDWSRPITVPKQMWGNFHQWGENLVWNEWDKGMRVNIYNRLKAKGMSGEEAAKQATLAMNDYSRTGLTRFERNMTNVFFTYSWQKGRMRFFGNMARTFTPFSDLSMAERAYLEGATRRWAMTNIVLPHLVRALEGRASAGLFGSKIPIGTVPGYGGKRRTLYVNFGGWLQDGIDFITHPVNYTLSHINPLVDEAATIVKSGDLGYQTGKTPGQVIREQTAAEAVRTLPAGVTTSLRMAPDIARDPGGTLLRMTAPFMGMPEYTTPPPPEDPAAALQQALAAHSYLEAAAIMRNNQIQIDRIKRGLPYEEQRKLERAYQLMMPRIGGIKQPRY